MIIRTIDIVLVGALLASATWTFKVKNDAQNAMQRLQALEAEIASEREAIALLKADWSLLTSPDRLEALVARHAEELRLEQAEAKQFTTIDQIPLKRPPEPEIGTLEQTFSQDTDLTAITGGIAPSTPSSSAGELAKP